LPPQPKKKRGLLSKIFGRKKGKEHASFSCSTLPGPLLEETATTPTVVILNSLNHNQLLELLKVPTISLLHGCPRFHMAANADPPLLINLPPTPSHCGIRETPLKRTVKAIRYLPSHTGLQLKKISNARRMSGPTEGWLVLCRTGR